MSKLLLIDYEEDVRRSFERIEIENAGRIE